MFLWQIDGEKASPFGGKLSPKVTDEGLRSGSCPLPGNRGRTAPHPASVGASATFPPKGEGAHLFLSSQNATAPAAATFSESTPCCIGIMTV